MGSSEECHREYNFGPLEELPSATSEVELEGVWECEQHVEAEKKNQLQQLEAVDGIIDKVKEIQELKKDINEI